MFHGLRRGLYALAWTALLAATPVSARDSFKGTPPAPVDLGVLAGETYRGTQLQGHIIGQDLMVIPEYLLDPGLDFPYQRNPALSKEVPFVDSFSITRFLGGYPENWLKQFGQWDDKLGRQSLDYAIRGPDGQIAYRPDLISKRLTPYLDAGYRLSDITIVMDNVPWAVASRGGQEGPYGQNETHADKKSWQLLVERFAADLKSLYGQNAAPDFKLGNEFDTLKSFDGTASEYLDYYEASYRALRAAFPDSKIASGEFTRDGRCEQKAVCVYDTQEFLAAAASRGLMPSYVPRSLNGMQFTGNPAPASAIRRAVASYQRLPGVTAEIHQMGLIGQPFGSFENLGSERGPRAAAWEFIVMTGITGSLKPRRMFHWTTFSRIANSDFALLNGTGMLRLLLDHYRGARQIRLPLALKAGDKTQAVAVAYRTQETMALIVAVSTLDMVPQTANVTIDLSALDLPQGAKPRRVIRYEEDANVFMTIRAELAAAGNLKTEFEVCAYCTSDAMRMARDAASARKMLLGNQARYESEIKEDLVFSDAAGDPGIAMSSPDGLLDLAVKGNEVLVLEF